MRVLAVNGSPRAAAGNTHRILQPFLEGAAEAGAQTECVSLAARDIHYCTGELHCFFKIPGRCIWKDDMADLLPKVGAADVLVVATPLYFGGPTAQLKAFVDRLTPLLDPVSNLVEGDEGPSLRPGFRVGKAVLVSSCGDWDPSAFGLLVDWAHLLATALCSDYAGALLRPHAPALHALEEQGRPPRDVYDAAREAGRQIVREGAIDPGTLDAVTRELTTFEAYCRDLGEAFRRAAEEGGAVEA
jgi:multimeric flavodoxin WrbA